MPSLSRLSLVGVILCAVCSQVARGDGDSRAARIAALTGREPGLDLSAYRSVQTRPDQDDGLALALAISCGGHRAANLAAGVMMGLEAIAFEQGGVARNVLREVDYLSTVSGGGFAAAAYIASLYDHLEAGGSHGDYSLRLCLDDDKRRNVNCDPRLLDHLEHDYTVDLIGGILSTRSWGEIDRGDYLERALDDRLLGAAWRSSNRSLRLGDMFVEANASRRVRLPYWIANATISRTGALFAFTPDQLRAYGIVGYTHRLEQVSYDREELYDAFLAKVPMAIGMTASAAAPVAIPATTLVSELDPRAPYLHLSDGCMTENLGVMSALRVLQQEKGRRKVLLVIDAYRRTVSPFSSDRNGPSAAASAARTVRTGRDAWHCRAHELAEKLGRSVTDGQPVQVVFLSVEDLAMEDGRLRAAVRDVESTFTISDEEQQMLIDAGQRLAEIKRAEILRVIRSIDI